MVAHGQDQLKVITPTVDEHGGVTFSTPPTPLFSALRYLFTCISGGTEMPLWMILVFQYLMPILPRYRVAYGEVSRYIQR